MTRTQIQLPEPLYRRLKEIALSQDWSLSEVIRKAAEHFVTRFPEAPRTRAAWSFPTLECGGDYLIDPASVNAEADAILERSIP